ncbi:MAG TPA: S-layer homology domain-containing protein [Bacilli bacterium]|nr:S-layer homology domain-containing protein [Bacilli bacterium]
MLRKRNILIGCLAAGLLLSGVPSVETALAETTLDVEETGSGVTVQGFYTDQGTPLAGVPAFLTVRGTDGQLYHLDQVQTASDGSYRFEWTMPSQASSGYYTVEVHIQGDKESTEFHYEATTDQAPIPPVSLSPYRFTGELNGGQPQIVLAETDDGLSISHSGGVTYVNVTASKARSRVYSASSDVHYLTISVPERGRTVQVNVPGSVIEEMLDEFGADAHLLVAAEAGSYDLPLKAVNSQLLDGVITRSDGALQVTISSQAQTPLSSISREVTALGARQLVDPVTFGVNAVYSSQTIPLRDYGSSFVRYSINLSGAELNQGGGRAQSTLLEHPRTGELVTAPSKLYRDSLGHGKLVITRTGNGTYAAVEADRSFGDTRNRTVENLASKFVIFGRSETQFDPRGSLTRAEFATLMVRALGLSDKQGSAIFKDVPRTSWYQEPVAIGSSLGLINGYSTSQFAPQDKITREQMAALLSRSLQFVKGQRPYVDTTRILGTVSDRDKISAWARDDMALALSAGLLYTNRIDQIDPQRYATREEAAEMLSQLLKYLDML